jgi:hypothetical protein
MKPHHFIFIIFSALLFSCGNVPEKPLTTEPLPVDSFIVSGFDVGQQTQDCKYINDTLLCSYDLISEHLSFFHKNKSGNYSVAVKKEIDTEFWSSYFMGDDGRHYFIDHDNFVTVYDPFAEHKMDTCYIRHRFRYMLDTFALNSANNTPLLKIRDTLIAIIGPRTDEGYKAYFKEQEISEFKIDQKTHTISYLRSYFTKPSNLSDFDYPFGVYCFVNNAIFMLYPPMDSLYIHNRSTNSTTKICINNPDYKMPAKFTCKAFTPEYGSCATKYQLHNFRYTAIYHNPLTRHFVLFYEAPVSDTIKGRVPTFDDQPLKALVLDEQFNQVSRLTFNKKFISAMSFFFIPVKGLAMPIFKGTDAHETTPFYIYNL